LAVSRSISRVNGRDGGISDTDSQKQMTKATNVELFKLEVFVQKHTKRDKQLLFSQQVAKKVKDTKVALGMAIQSCPLCN